MEFQSNQLIYQKEYTKRQQIICVLIHHLHDREGWGFRKISQWLNQSGQKKSEENYKNGKLDGKSTWWNKRGQKIRQKEYKSGKLDGKLIEWFQFNGEIKREENYKNGKILF